MYNSKYKDKEMFHKMKRIAIIFGILMFAQAAFAGGTVLFMDGHADNDANTVYVQQGPFDPNATYYTQDGNYDNSDLKGFKKTTKTRRFRLGRQPANDPNVYWNFGRVNFGSGFNSTGSSVKQY
jgi:hypothetical protein